MDSVQLFVLIFSVLQCTVGAITITVKKPEPRHSVHEFTNSASGLHLTCYSDGTYGLFVDGKLWLESAPTFFHSNGKMYTTEDDSLKLHGISKNSGEDRLGSWESVEYMYYAGNTYVKASFRGYNKLPAIIFEQSCPIGVTNTSVGNKDLLTSGFPGFQINGSKVALGYLSYGYIMVGNMGKKIGRWSADKFRIVDGRNGGPMALFDKSGKHALFMSPFDSFMATSVLHQKKQGRYYWGVMGSVKRIPPNFSFKTIIYYGSGINDAIAGWGGVMRKYYNKLPHYRESDFTNNYLSYWSDNGAYYVNYYVKGGLIQNRTYEEDMLRVSNYSKQLNIPYRSIQYSVWFKQGKYNGISLWEANPKLFPSGMRYMFEKTGLLGTAHNRYWSPDTKYAKQNGGKYDFVVEKLYALPVEERFWTDLFAVSQQYGFKTYMQDWLNKQFDEMDCTTNNVNTARDWLMQMGEGARKNDITIQYCMSESRHILQSLEIPVVTQARASNDYQPNDKLQWRIGISSMFAHAVGIAPYKDTFWTTTIQPDNYYHGTEPYPALQTVISTLSTGPVGPGDMVHGTNVSLLMKCCADDGLILKPSRPALAIDNQLLQTAFGGSLGPVGELWTTYSDIGSWRFGIIFATDMNNIFSIGPTIAHFGKNFPPSKVYSAGQASPAVSDFDDRHPVVITPKCTKKNFCLYYTCPVFTFRGEELLLLGELSKIVPISPQRVLSIQWDADNFLVKLKGASGEKVAFMYVLSGKRQVASCVMSPAGTAIINVRYNTCLAE